jgi:hypothetical protein
VNLGLSVGVAEIQEDGRLERDDGGGGIIGAEVSECSCELISDDSRRRGAGKGGMGKRGMGKGERDMYPSQILGSRKHSFITR